MMSVAFKEGVKVSPEALQDVIVATNQDIRQVNFTSVYFYFSLSVLPNIIKNQNPCIVHELNLWCLWNYLQVLHSLSMWSAKAKNLTSDQAKQDIGRGIKHIKKVTNQSIILNVLLQFAFYKCKSNLKETVYVKVIFCFSQ